MERRSPEEFTKALFQGIYLKDMDEDFDEPVEDTLPRAFKAYYYGDNNITKLAKKISKLLDKKAFVGTLYLDADDSIDSLCNTMKATCPTISKDNYEKVFGARFQTIIKNSAKKK